jgi:hypothetical protein
MTSDSSYALPRADHFNPMMLSATPFSGLISGGDIALQSTLNICTIGVGAAVKSLKTQTQTPVVLKEPHPNYMKPETRKIRGLDIPTVGIRANSMSER